MTVIHSGASALNNLTLRLPLVATMRIHESMNGVAEQKATDRVDMWLADLGQPVKLSRWATGFRTPELGVFSPAAMAERRATILDATSSSEDCRVVLLAHPGIDSTLPRAGFVIDAFGRCVARTLEVQPHLEAGALIVADGSDTTVNTTLVIDGQHLPVTGTLRTHLDEQSVRLGLQLSSPDSAALMTISMAGRLTPGSPRTLLQAVTALAA